jgi:hypothetical protein
MFAYLALLITYLPFIVSSQQISRPIYKPFDIGVTMSITHTSVTLSVDNVTVTWADNATPTYTAPITDTVIVEHDPSTGWNSYTIYDNESGDYVYVTFRDASSAHGQNHIRNGYAELYGVNVSYRSAVEILYADAVSNDGDYLNDWLTYFPPSARSILIDKYKK